MITINKIVEKYCEFPLPLKATAWIAVCQFLQRGIGILTTPFVVRMLSKEEYGRVGIFNSWESIFATLIALSASKAVFNLCVKNERREDVLSSLLCYCLSIAIVWGILLLFTIEFVVRATGLTYSLILCLYLLSISTCLIGCWTLMKQYEYSYKEVVLSSFSYTFCSSFGGLAAIAFLSRTAEAKIMPQVLTAVVIGTIVMVSSFKSSKVFYDKEVWKFAFCFCVPLLPHYLSEIFLMSSDQIMIGRMCGSSDVAVYNVAYTVGTLIVVVTSVINASFAPYQYQKIKVKEYRVLAKNTNCVIVFVALCLCGIMLFGREIVLFFGGQKYFDSISLIIPISLGVFFNYVFQLFARVQEYFEQKHTIVIATVSCAVLNVVLNYVFIGLYGYKAAAYTTFASYFSFCFLHYLFYRMACKRYVGREIYDIKCLALISAALILIAAVINAMSEMYVMKYIAIMVAGILMIWHRKRVIEFIREIRNR